MKKFLLFFGMVLNTAVHAQITTTRMNEFRINDTQEKVEQLLGEKLEIKFNESDWLVYTDAYYEGIPFQLGFVSVPKEDGIFEAVILEIKTTSPDIKTLSGVGVGDSFDKLWETYKKDFNISIWFMWDEEGQNFDKNRRVFEISGAVDGHVIHFYTMNDIITEIILTFNDGC